MPAFRSLICLTALASSCLADAGGPKVVRRFNAAPDLHKCDTATWFKAARSGDLLGLKACVLGGTKVDRVNEVGCTAVHDTANNNHQEALEWLHSKGANMDFKCTHTRKTPLMYAAAGGYTSGVKFLVDQAKVDSTHELVDSRGVYTAVSMAAHNGHIDVVLYLHKLESSFHPKDRDAWTGSWLSWAAASGEPDMVEQLAKGKEPGGTSLEEKDSHGMTAAFWAAQMGNTQALKVLVGQGADLTSTSHTGLTMLMAAAFWGHGSTVEYLIGEGVHADQHDSASWTALMWAASNNQVGTMKRLVAAGADIGSQGGEWNALMVAAAAGKEEAAMLLVGSGARKSAVNKAGQSAAELAISNGFSWLADRLNGHAEL